jgi:hypothetical protein
MLMIVFGAGASYDSAPSHPTLKNEDWHSYPYRLPLADQLFEERTLFADVARNFPRLLAIIPELRHLKPGMSVEHELERFREEVAVHPDVKKQLAAVRFYLQWIIWECQSRWNSETTRGVTNYRTLLNQIERRRRGERVCLVTFNYDTLLEEAFTSINKRFDSVDAYVSGTNYSIFKLHGSVNWVHDLDSPMLVDSNRVGMANKAIEDNSLDVSNRYYVVSEGPLPISSMRLPGKPEDKVVVPAIAIPVEKKNQYECPPTHVGALTDLIPQVDKLVMIGWRGGEENFVNLLAKGLLFHKRIPIMVVSGSKDSAVKLEATFSKVGIQAQDWQHAESGFTDLTRSRRIEEFIG